MCLTACAETPLPQPTEARPLDLALPKPLILPLCEERPCIDLDCSDASAPGCTCILGVTGQGLYCSPGYALCELLECDALECPIVGSSSCYCLRQPLAPQPCTDGGPAT